ncbi:MAG TPA: transposase [Gaiellaceae bacterium]|nr:transposase [Gaiellaceae bacterium]
MTSLIDPTVPRGSAAALISKLLDSQEIVGLISELESLRWTGRKGYSIRSLVGACLVKSLYAIPTWSRTAALIAEHRALQDALGDAPSVYALYRFTTKLREHKPMLDACLARVTESLRAELPEYGQDIAIDASDLPAHGNGQRFLSKDGPERETYSDPDASWGHRSAISTRKGGGFYGYKLHAAVCARTDLPITVQVETARAHESSIADDLLQRVRELKFQPETATLDKGYDVAPVYDACERVGALPIIPLRKTPAVKRGDHHAPECEHGTWKFAGADAKRKLAKWRCPTHECQPASVWRKATRLHPLVPRESKRWGDLYRGRGSVERAFGRLKNEAGLAPLRVRGLERVALHADLCILATLASALARARAVPLAA